MSLPLVFGRGTPQPRKIDVFDDFRPYKLSAIIAVNKGVFKLEKPFIPLVVCNNIPQLAPHYNIHNGQYKIIKDLPFIHKIVETNGGFNFSLLSFDVSQFILSPGFYVKNIERAVPYADIPEFSYTIDLYDPLYVPGEPIRGQIPLPPNSITIPQTIQDTSAILVYLEV